MAEPASEPLSGDRFQRWANGLSPRQKTRLAKAILAAAMGGAALFGILGVVVAVNNPAVNWAKGWLGKILAAGAILPIGIGAALMPIAAALLLEAGREQEASAHGQHGSAAAV